MRFFGQVRPVESLGMGVFDGVHIGHQQIVAQTDSLLTLFPHPDRVVKPGHYVPYLTSPLELASLCQQLIVGRFSRQTMRLSPESFIQAILAAFTPKRLVVGEDFRFGCGQAGSAEWLLEHSKQLDVSVSVQPLIMLNGIAVKSTDIRAHILSGQFPLAIQKMGHDYPLFGRVVFGEGRARQIGFPTANLRVYRGKCLPPFGVYGGNIILDGVGRPCLVYIGNRPSMGLGRVIEVHIPGYSGDLYGRRIRPWLNRFIRPQMTFNSVDDLVQQLHQDIVCLHH